MLNFLPTAIYQSPIDPSQSYKTVLQNNVDTGFNQTINQFQVSNKKAKPENDKDLFFDGSESVYNFVIKLCSGKYKDPNAILGIKNDYSLEKQNPKYIYNMATEKPLDVARFIAKHQLGLENLSEEQLKNLKLGSVHFPVSPIFDKQYNLKNPYIFNVPIRGIDGKSGMPLSLISQITGVSIEKIQEFNKSTIKNGCAQPGVLLLQDKNILIEPFKYLNIDVKEKQLYNFKQHIDVYTNFIEQMRLSGISEKNINYIQNFYKINKNGTFEENNYKCAMLFILSEKFKETKDNSQTLDVANEKFNISIYTMAGYEINRAIAKGENHPDYTLAKQFQSDMERAMQLYCQPDSGINKKTYRFRGAEATDPIHFFKTGDVIPFHTPLSTSTSQSVALKYMTGAEIQNTETQYHRYIVSSNNFYTF